MGEIDRQYNPYTGGLIAPADTEHLHIREKCIKFSERTHSLSPRPLCERCANVARTARGIKRDRQQADDAEKARLRTAV